MKKYLVIGNPIDHSLSPNLHNHWINKNRLNAVYEKKKINESGIKDIVSQIRNGKISGINVTVPYKNLIIPYLDELSPEANESQSVNTIYKENEKIIGHNTDAGGFGLALSHINYDVKDKKIFILGAGGVVPSIIVALKKKGVSKIIISNRTQEKAENMKKIDTNIEILKWGKTPDFNMIINATSLGLKNNDEIKLNYSAIGGNKLFFDVIYNPKQTKFLSKAKEFGNQIENGKMMFIYQAHQAFTLWNKIMPDIDSETIKLLDQ